MPSRPANAEAILSPALPPDQPWAEVEDRLRANTAQLWMGQGAAMITEIVGDAIHVWLGAGDLAELLRMRPTVETWGHAVGCKRATIHGRLGWTRALKPYGFRLIDGLLEKTL